MIAPIAACAVGVELNELPLFCPMIQQTHGDKPAFVIRKIELSDIALQRLVMFGLFLVLSSDRSRTGSIGRRKLPVQETGVA